MCVYIYIHCRTNACTRIGRENAKINYIGRRNNVTKGGQKSLFPLYTHTHTHTHSGLYIVRPFGTPRGRVRYWNFYVTLLRSSRSVAPAGVIPEMLLPFRRYSSTTTPSETRAIVQRLGRTNVRTEIRRAESLQFFFRFHYLPATIPTYRPRNDSATC